MGAAVGRSRAGATTGRSGTAVSGQGGGAQCTCGCGEEQDGGCRVAVYDATGAAVGCVAEQDDACGAAIDGGLGAKRGGGRGAMAAGHGRRRLAVLETRGH